MNNREFAALTARYEQRIELELSSGTINRNKDGKIKKSLLLNRDITTGRERRIQAEGRTVKECARKLAEQHRRQLEHIQNIVRERTFGEVAEEWYMVEIKDSGISAGNKKNYRTDLNLHILPKLRDLDITQLRKKDYQLFLNGFAGKGESLVKKIRMTLMRIIKYAIENEYMPDRMISLNLPETKAVKSRAVLTPEQIKLLVKAENAYPPAYVFILMLSTGMRPCEMYGLTYDDIDFENKIIHIKKSKTDNGIRVIPVPEYALQLISKDRASLQAKGYDPEYVFHQQIDPTKPHNANTLRSTWQTTLRTMDIINGAKTYQNKIVRTTIPNKDDLSVYNLRHTYCTMLNDCGIGEYFKKRLMGHTLKDSITDSVYTHSTEGRIIKAASPFLTYIQNLFEKAAQ